MGKDPLLEEERRLLDFLLKTNNYRPGKVSFSIKEACDILKMNPEELRLLLKNLSSKNFLIIKRTPLIFNDLCEILDEIDELDFDYMDGKMATSDYDEKRKALIAKLNDVIGDRKEFSEYGKPFSISGKSDVIKSWLLRIDALRRLSVSTTQSEDFKKTSEELVSLQNKLDKYKESVWNKVLIRGICRNKVQVKLMILKKGVGLQEIEASSEEILKLEELLERIDHSMTVLVSHIIARMDLFDKFSEELEILDARFLVGEVKEEKYNEERAKIVERISVPPKSLQECKDIIQYTISRIKEFREKEILPEDLCYTILNSLENDEKMVTKCLYKELQEGGYMPNEEDDMVIMELSNKAEDLIPRCPIDQKIIDGTFPTVSCPICSSEYCLDTCVPLLLSEDSLCRICGRYDFNRMRPKLDYKVYLIRLEGLKKSGKIPEGIYTKLREEYEQKLRGLE